jgi:hypothetical protein
MKRETVFSQLAGLLGANLPTVKDSAGKHHPVPPY